MLASGLTGGPNELVGKTLMDHPALYAWGLASEPVGAYRGPLSTAGIEDLRAGPFRQQHAAFRFDVGNDGWRAPAGAPDTAVSSAITNQKLCGKKLRAQLEATLPRHVRLSLAVEQLPDPFNRVSIDPAIVDKLGIPRPVISYRIDEYTLAVMAEATRVYQQIFAQAKITDCTPADQSATFPSAKSPREWFITITAWAISRARMPWAKIRAIRSSIATSAAGVHPIFTWLAPEVFRPWARRIRR
jgi:choline dehydrogenase-like flavoprotein